MFDELDQLLASDTFAKGKTKSTLKLKEGERREVCILFADVKGFMELSEKLDHEEVHNILDKLMQLFSVRIKHYGGYVDKYEGDLVMALFGAKVAREGDTERAIHAALQMLEILQQFNNLLSKKLRSDARLEVRIGINTGWVTTGRVGEKREGDFTVYGNAVNLASRMESNAPLNRIMLSEKTMESVKDAFEFEDHGEIKIKGISEPVSVFLVKSLKAERSHRWQMRRSKYVGRDNELAFLNVKYKNMKRRLTDSEFHEYKPPLIGIKGEAGIGKSRLADEFLKSKPELPFYLHGAAPRIAPPPFSVFTSLMRRYLGITRIDNKETTRQKLEAGLKELEEYLNNREEVDHLRNQLPILGRLLGVRYDDVRLQLESKELKPHIFTAIRYFLEALAAKANRQNAPLVMIFDDMQWLDEASAAVIVFLMFTLNLEERRRQKHYKHLLILFTYRPEWKLPRRLKTDVDFHEIELTSIDEKSGEELIKSMSEDITISEKTLRIVMEKSDGNPFYIEEWVNLILSTPELERQEILPVPNTLHALVLSRIDRLEQDVKLLLQKAAVIGREFFVKVLQEMEMKLERQSEIDEHLKHLERNDFVLPLSATKISAYLFKHIITQEVAYNTLLIANRKILHRIAADVIEEQFSDSLEGHWRDLAEHYLKAEVWEKAVDYLLIAADQAREHYNNQAAIVLYSRLLSLRESHPEVVEQKTTVKAMRGKGNVLELIGKWKEAENLYRSGLNYSESLPDEMITATILAALGNILQLQGNFDEALECLERSLSLSETSGDKREISSITNKIGIVFEKRGEFDQALNWYQKSLSISEELEDKKGVLIAILHMGNVFNFRGDYERVLECYQKCLFIAEELQDNRAISSVMLGKGNVHIFRGDYDRGLECYVKSLSIAEELGDKRGISYAVGNMGNLFGDRGDFASALECHQKKLSLAEELGDRRGVSRAVGNMGGIFFDLKDYANAKEYLERAVNLSRELGAKDHLCYFMLIIIRLNIELKSYMDARDYCREAGELADHLKNNDYILQIQIQLYKIDFLTAEDDALRVAALDALSILLEQTTDDKRCADMHYELTAMQRTMNHSDQVERHRLEAIRLYERLYTRKPDYAFKRRLEELGEEVADV